jgi:hypothetical protein
MSSELERRLAGLIHELPEPEPDVGDRALAASLAALRPVAPSRRRLRTTVVALAAAVVLLAVAAGSLAAAGVLHVSLGTKRPRFEAPPTTLRLPPGANGIAVIVRHKLSVVTKGGFRLQGLVVSAAALSPRALYVAAGVGNSLVAMAPDGRRAWSRPAGGEVREIAWAPDGLRIAYTVLTRRHLALHVIWGNGTHDEIVDPAVRWGFGALSWRADSLAFAYLGLGGHVVIFDLAHASRSVVPDSRDTERFAFAPTGDVLAISNRRRTALVGANGSRIVWRGTAHGIGWLDGQLAIADRIPGLPRPILAFATRGQLLAAAAVKGRTIRVLAGPPGHLRVVLKVGTLYGCNADRTLHGMCVVPLEPDGLQLR